ncbi:class D sortase [Proteobacteria bacterium 005FR1]|nr:class D sortase [Proteobacteria bacterium 005FR1]
MRQGLERLFWVIGGLLVLPFILQQGLVLSRNSDAAAAPQLYSAPVAHPAIATSLRPAEIATTRDATDERESLHTSAPKQPAANRADAGSARIREGLAFAKLHEPDTSSWSKSRLSTWRELAERVTGRPVGSLLIPSVELEIPVFPDADELAFTLGAGIIPGTGSLEGDSNIGMASHRDGHFRQLKNVSVGDLILVKTPTRLRQFRVVQTQVVEPSDTWVLDPTDQAQITLVTCYPFHFVGSAPQRYIVSAQEVHSELTSVRPSHTVIGGYHETLKF